MIYESQRRQRMWETTHTALKLPQHVFIVQFNILIQMFSVRINNNVYPDDNLSRKVFGSIQYSYFFPCAIAALLETIREFKPR